VKDTRGGSSRRVFNLVILAALVLGVGGIVWATRRGGAGDVVTVDPKLAVGQKAEGYVLGSAQAPVEIVEFADFECPACAQFATVTEPDVRERLVKTGQARYRLFDFQVTGGHRNSPAASLAAACADDQGKFWEMHDRLFVGQAEWRTPIPGYDGGTNEPKSVFAGYARQLGLDVNAWNQCYDSRKHVARVAANLEEAQRRGVNSTPTFIVGSKQLSGGRATYDAIKALVDSASAGAPAGAAPVGAAPATAPAAGR
jgi:protein-disulfide isomerase